MTGLYKVYSIVLYCLSEMMYLSVLYVFSDQTTIVVLSLTNYDTVAL